MKNSSYFCHVKPPSSHTLPSLTSSSHTLPSPTSSSPSLPGSQKQSLFPTRCGGGLQVHLLQTRSPHCTHQLHQGHIQHLGTPLPSREEDHFNPNPYNLGKNLPLQKQLFVLHSLCIKNHCTTVSVLAAVSALKSLTSNFSGSCSTE